MTIRIISIGKTNIPYVNDGILEFAKRLKHYTKLSWEELPEIKNGSKLTKSELKKTEGNSILTRLKLGDSLILLDEGGQQLSSVEFSKWLQLKSMSSAKNIVFAIGGAYGFSDQVYERSAAKISLSKMTFNHQMVRLIFIEQLYRAFTIQKGEPYHHV